MRNLALITIILLFLTVFTAIKKIYTVSFCNSGFIEMVQKIKLKNPDCHIIFSSFNNPAECYFVYVHQGGKSNDSQNILSSRSFQNQGKSKSTDSPVQTEINHSLPEFHNTSEATIAYFLIIQ